MCHFFKLGHTEIYMNVDVPTKKGYYYTLARFLAFSFDYITISLKIFQYENRI